MEYDALLEQEFKQSRFQTQESYSNLVRKKCALVDLMGGKCVHCGFTNKKALQIDHVNGDGYLEKHSWATKSNYFKKIQESYLKGEDHYQILCANCNWIKRTDNLEGRRRR